MANVVPTISSIAFPAGAVAVTWTPIGDSDTCINYMAPGMDCVSVQATGTFGGASVALQGSNDGTNFAGMTGKGGTSAIAITSAGMKAPNENAIYYRPVSSGGSSSSLTVVALFFPRIPRVY